MSLQECPAIALSEVTRFLVESEPLKNVTEVSSYLEAVVSCRESHCSALEQSLDSCVETGKQISECVSRITDSWKTTENLTKRRLQADQIVERRFKDLREALGPSQLPAGRCIAWSNVPNEIYQPSTTPLTNPPAPSSRIIQMTAWVNEINLSQQIVLEELTSLKEGIHTVFDSMTRLQGSAELLARRTSDSVVGPDLRSACCSGAGEEIPPHHLHLTPEDEVLHERYFQLRQDASSSAIEISENHERIRSHLSILLSDCNRRRDAARYSLADELINFRPRPRFSEDTVGHDLWLWLREVYTESATLGWSNYLDIFQQKTLISLQLIIALFVLLTLNVLLRRSAAYQVPLPDGEGTLQVLEIPHQPIRDALLGTNMDQLDETIRQGLFPRKT